MEGSGRENAGRMHSKYLRHDFKTNKKRQGFHPAFSCFEPELFGYCDTVKSILSLQGPYP
jgi:hypothetical protein